MNSTDKHSKINDFSSEWRKNRNFWWIEGDQLEIRCRMQLELKLSGGKFGCDLEMEEKFKQNAEVIMDSKK